MSSLLEDDDELIQQDDSAIVTSTIVKSDQLSPPPPSPSLQQNQEKQNQQQQQQQNQERQNQPLQIHNDLRSPSPITITPPPAAAATNPKLTNTSGSPLTSQVINILTAATKSPSLVPEVDDCLNTLTSPNKQHKRIKSADQKSPDDISNSGSASHNNGLKPIMGSTLSDLKSSLGTESIITMATNASTSTMNLNTPNIMNVSPMISSITPPLISSPNMTSTTTTTTTATNNANSHHYHHLNHSFHDGGSKSLPVSPLNSSVTPTSTSFKSEPFLNSSSHSPPMYGNRSITPSANSPPFKHSESSQLLPIPGRNRTQSNTPLNLSSELGGNQNTQKRKDSITGKDKSHTKKTSANGSPTMSSGQPPKQPNPVMQFLGKMSLSKERMSKLVSQAKEVYKGQPGSFNTNPSAQPNTVPYEGMFGVPLRVLLRYQTETGNQIPSILNSLFSILESSTSLSTSQLFATPVPKNEIDHLKTLYDNSPDFVLKGYYSPHLIIEVLIEFFQLLPEPIIPVEFYETLLNYYQTETLLQLMIRRMQNPNKAILFRLMRYLKDVMVYANFNEVTLPLLVDKFHRFLLRPSPGTVSGVAISEQHQQATKDILAMFIQQVDTLFASVEDRSNPDDSLILHVEEVLANTSQKIQSVGNLWLYHKQIVWRPKVNSNGDPELVIPFNSILKVVLSNQTSRKESQKVLANFTIYCTSEIKTIITFSFQTSSTCKLIYAYINSFTKSISNINRIVSQKLDLYSLELESLPNEMKQLKHLQELNLSRNKFKLIPGDLARLSSLRTITIEENSLSEISSEMADFIGTRLASLENVSFSNNRLVVIPPLYTWMRLKTLNISNNYLTRLPPDIFQIPTLEVLRVGNNQIDDNGIPKVITSTRLRSLDLRKNLLQSIPEGIINLVELQVLSLQENQITELTPDIQKLTSLTELNLNSNQISILPSQLLLLTNLKKLYLDNNQINSISSAIHRMQSLIELRLTNNNIARLPPGIVALKKLNSLELTGNKPLKDNIPEKYISKGKEGIFSYFSESMRTNVPCYRTRIIILGEKNTGKSNLIKCFKKLPKSSFTTPVLSSSPSSSSLTQLKDTNVNNNSNNNSSTQKQQMFHNVLDIQDWQCPLHIDGAEGKKKKSIVNIHLWEFEGLQNEISHVFFVSNIIYTVCFNLAKFATLESNDQKIISYLYRIHQRDRKAVIMLVGTHLDEVTISKKSLDKQIDSLSSKLRGLFPTFQISIHSVTSTKSDGDGIRKLRRDVKSTISKLPILRQTYPASFMFLEDYLREESNLMSPPLVNKKTLQQMARTMELHNEPHFSQLKSLFNSLGSIQCFEQFIRMEAGSLPTKTEMISLNPIWIARALAALVGFDPYKELPYMVQGEDASVVTGILPHRVLRYVWGTNSQYYVPETFFNLFLSLLESNDLAINIYSLAESATGSHHPSITSNASSSSLSSSTSNDMISALNHRRRMSSIGGGMTNFSAKQKVRNGRSSSFNARFGWALVNSLLPPFKQQNQLELLSLWEQYPEKPELLQFVRRYSLDFIPSGFFGRLLSRLMQVTNLLKSWNNVALLVPDLPNYQKQQFDSERILVTIDSETNIIEVKTRLLQPSNLSSQIYSIIDSLVVKWYKLTYRAYALCSHCVQNKYPNPYYFKLEDCEAQLFHGEKSIGCQYHSKQHQSQIIAQPVDNSNSSGSSSGSNTPKISRKESLKELSAEKLKKDSKASQSHHNLNSPGSGSFNDFSQPVEIKSLLLDHCFLCEFITEINYSEIEVVKNPNQQQDPLYNSNQSNSPTTLAMGVRGSNQFVNIKLFNSPSEHHSNYSKIMSNFRHEVLSLYTFRHPNVISIIGISMNPVAIITENPTFGNKGSTTLSEYIQDRQKHPEIPWNIKLKIALDIAKAMERLQNQSPPFLLTNLSSNNVLLEKLSKSTVEKSMNGADHHSGIENSIVAKITDFSYSSLLPSLFPTDTSPKPWQAPEVLQKLNYHELTDSYSYGIILYELLTRSVVFQEHNDKFSSMIITGQRPSIPPDCLPSFADLIKDCWASEPLNRPSFTTIILQLNQIKNEIESKADYNHYNSLSSDTGIYSNNLPLPSGGSIIFNDRIIHFGGWNTSKPHSNVYALNLSSMVFEDKLSVVLSDRSSSTYRAFYQHMQTEYNEENLVFFEAIKAFKNLPNQTPADREHIKGQAKKIYTAFIGSNSPREINLPFNLKTELQKKIESPEGPSVTVFNDTLAFVISSIDDSFHRFKFSAPSNARNGWVKLDCKGTSPPPMIGHSSILWNNNLIIVGGWANGSRQMNQVYLLNLESLEWVTYICTGDVPPSSTGAISTVLYGDYLLIYYERADSPKQQIYRLSLTTFIWYNVKLSNLN